MNSSNSLRGRSARACSRAFAKPGLMALLLALITTTTASRAATPPPPTLMYTAANSASIHGGVATIGTSGITYFSTLSTATTRANVTSLYASGAERWKFSAPGDGTGFNMYGIPVLDAAGQKLYIGSDAGIFYCRSTTDGTSAAGWTDFTVPGSGDRRIRSGAALDPNNPLGSTVYFHCNDGYVYALDANTGAQRWRAYSGNVGGPPADSTFNPQPVSSSPVVDSSGVVYVGSSDGSVYALNASNGSQVYGA